MTCRDYMIRNPPTLAADTPLRNFDIYDVALNHVD